eukprot:scaffold72589_cov45-Phaeocystis_antarctica.AAC.2
MVCDLSDLQSVRSFATLPISRTPSPLSITATTRCLSPQHPLSITPTPAVYHPTTRCRSRPPPAAYHPRCAPSPQPSARRRPPSTASASTPASRPRASLTLTLNLPTSSIALANPWPPPPSYLPLPTFLLPTCRPRPRSAQGTASRPR